MLLTKEQVDSIRKSGTVPIVDLKIFDSINKLKFSDAILEHEDYVKSIYTEYIDKLMNMNPKYVNGYLKALKISETLDNQSLEMEDSFLISIYMNTVREGCIDYLIKATSENKVLGKKDLTRNALIRAHRKLLEGTSSTRFLENDFRTNDDAFVGERVNDETIIHYFTLPHEKISEALDKTIELYNSDDNLNHIFLKSQMIHAAIAGLQMFDDGNSRLARIVQNIKLGELTNKEYNTNFSMPIIYGTRAYFPMRGQYRYLVQNLVINPNEENWNKWFKFNLNRAEDTLTVLEDKVKEYTKRIG